MNLRRNSVYAALLAVALSIVLFGLLQRLSVFDGYYRTAERDRAIIVVYYVSIAFFGSLLTLAACTQAHEGWRRVALGLTPIALVGAVVFSYVQARREFETIVGLFFAVPLALIGVHGGVYLLRLVFSKGRRLVRWVLEGFASGQRN